MGSNRWAVATSGPAWTLCLALMCFPALANPSARGAGTDEGGRRQRIGLVLGGGAARGGAHIGVLKVLEELRVPVDCVVGTSMGSIVGGLYSTGLSPTEMETVLQKIDWAAAFSDKPDRRQISFRRKKDDDLALFPFELGIGRGGVSLKSGIVAGSKIEFLFRTLTLDASATHDFDQLHVPFRAVAADLRTGDAVVLDHGDLALAMRASMSIPGIFTPVELGDRVLVDGGIALNLPVEVARAMGAERIIAVDVGTPPKESAKGLSATGVLSQMVAIMGEKNVNEQRALIGPRDLLMTPDLHQITSADFAKIDQAIAAGEKEARRYEQDLRTLSVPQEEYEVFLSRQRRGGDRLIPAPKLDGVRAEVRHRDGSRQDSRLLASRARSRPGGTLDVTTLSHDLERISQAGEFESVGFRIDRQAGRNDLVLEATEKSWGPGYLRFGLGAESNFEGDSEFRALANYRRPNLNRLGAEWRTILGIGNPASLRSEFYQPLEPSGFWFVAPRLDFERQQEARLLIGGDLEVGKTRSATAGLDFGLQLRNYGEIRLGVLRGNLDLNSVTESSFGPLDRDVGGARLKATLDQIDNVFFPTHGNLSRLELFVSRESLGADDEYERLEAETLQAWTLGRNTFVGSIRLGTNLGSGVPLYDQFELGGFLNLSSFRRGVLRGNVSVLSRLIDYWQVSSRGRLARTYLGAGLEAGNAWTDVGEVDTGDLLFSGLIFFGIDTAFSPVYLGYAMGEGGEHQAYLFIGRPF